jgi:ParB/RepB/Spo0J family partition protein
MTEVREIRTEDVVAGDNDRKRFDGAALSELADSIRARGLAQPITVRPILVCSCCGHRDSDAPLVCERCENDDLVEKFEIVAGERRFRAVSQVLGRDIIAAIVRDDLDDETASAIMLVENTSREDLNPIEEAQAYRARIERYGWSAERVAETAGVSEGLVKRRISLLELVPDVQCLIASCQLPIGHAEAMTALDSNRQRIALRIYNESKGGLSIKDFRGIVGQLLEEQSQDSLFDLENFWVEQVQSGADLPRRGKRAITGAPTRDDLPEVELSSNDSTAMVIDRYISVLLGCGLKDEAGVVGTLYTALVRGNFMSVPMGT